MFVKWMATTTEVALLCFPWEVTSQGQKKVNELTSWELKTFITNQTNNFACFPESFSSTLNSPLTKQLNKSYVYVTVEEQE